MKTLLKITLLQLVLLLCMPIYAQQSCKVLLPSLQGSYTGKCKKGLAHGKGKAVGTDTYEGKFFRGLPDGAGICTFANGDVYAGNWKLGKRNGEGALTIHLAERDSVVSGLWENDVYKGPKPQKPVVIYSSGVDRYNFQKNGEQRRRVLIDIFQNGSRNLTVSNFLISSTSGFDTKLSGAVGYDLVTFPVRIKLLYTTLNKLKTQYVNVKFEFEISEPGDWMVTLQN